MSDLGYRADGINRALAAGGVELQLYRRPGFAAGWGVRRVTGSVASGSGWKIDDPEIDSEDDDD